MDEYIAAAGRPREVCDRRKEFTANMAASKIKRPDHAAAYADVYRSTDVNKDQQQINAAELRKELRRAKRAGEKVRKSALVAVGAE